MNLPFNCPENGLEIEIKWVSFRNAITPFINKKGFVPIIYINNDFFYHPGAKLSVSPDLDIIDKGIEHLTKNAGFNSVEHFFRCFNTDFKGQIIKKSPTNRQGLKTFKHILHLITL